MRKVTELARSMAATELMRTQPNMTERTAYNKAVSVLAGRMAAEVSGSGLAISHEPDGRPFFADRSDVCVSISHTGDFIAVSAERLRHGIDIERVSRVQRNTQRIVHRFFSEGERQWLSRFRDERWQYAFTLIWTRKEALIKAGCGTLGQLALLDVCPTGKPSAQISIAGKVWHFASDHPGERDTSGCMIPEQLPVLSVCAESQIQLEPIITVGSLYRAQGM